jgi:hypothetical protein
MSFLSIYMTGKNQQCINKMHEMKKRGQKTALYGKHLFPIDFVDEPSCIHRSHRATGSSR